MNKDFLIKNKSGAVSSLTIALIYVIFMVITLITGTQIAGNYGGLEYTFLVLAVVVIILDVVDLRRMKKDQLMISFQEEKVVLATYWFSNKQYEYKLMDVVLTEKEIVFYYEGKRRTIGYLTKSDLIRAMKILKDNCEE